MVVTWATVCCGMHVPQNSVIPAIGQLQFVTAHHCPHNSVLSVLCTLLQVGDKFVLNCLGESNADGIMKHFLKRFAAGADRFEVRQHVFLGLAWVWHAAGRVGNAASHGFLPCFYSRLFLQHVVVGCVWGVFGAGQGGGWWLAQHHWHPKDLNNELQLLGLQQDAIALGCTCCN